jgi:hypothetical protein
MTILPAALTATDLLRLPDRLDGFVSWEDLADVLHDDWLSLHDGRGRWLVRVAEGLALVEEPGLLRARERRGLHRCGFRLQRAGDLRVWVWALPQDEPPDRSLAATWDLAGLLRRWDERSAAVRGRAVATVRDVLGADLHGVSVVLLPEPDDDDGWDQCPG